MKALLRRTRAAAGGDDVGDKKPIVRGELVLDPNRHACTVEGPSGATDCHRVSDSAGAGASGPAMSKAATNLMDAAYDDQVYVDDRTIDSHIKRLRKKFRDIDDTFDAIETLYGVGYRYNES